jgi:hypothetical protein
MIKAIVLAFRWRKLIEIGRYSTAAEIAVAEGVNDSYVCRIRALRFWPPISATAGNESASAKAPLAKINSQRKSARARRAV